MNEDNENQKNFDFLDNNKTKDNDKKIVKKDKVNTLNTDVVYLPVSSENLADYIANGFIGLLTKKDKVEDLQSKIWPKFITYTQEELANIEFFEDTVLVSLDKKFVSLIKSDLSINCIDKIFFESENLKKEFLATFRIMDDVPIEHFIFEVNEDLFNTKLKISKNNKEIINNNEEKDSQINNKLVSTSYVYGVLNYLREINNGTNVIQYIKDFSLNNSRQSIIKTIKQIGSIEEQNQEQIFLEEIINLLFNYHKSKEIESNNKLLSMLEKNILEKKDKINIDLVKKTFSKLRDVLDGIEEREELSDEKNKIIFRAFYLSIIVKNEEDFLDTVNRFNSGVIVTLVAFIFYSLKSGFRSSKVWRRNKEEYNILHKISNLIFSGNSLTFSASSLQFTKLNTVKREILLQNEVLLLLENKANPEFSHIQTQIEIIKKKGKQRYSDPIPYFNSEGRPTIKISLLDEQKNNDIDLILYEYKTYFSNKFSIIIETDILLDSIDIELAKDKINEVRFNCLVNIIENNDKIKLIATNLLETLDDAELEFGIQKLIEAKKALLKE